MNEFEIQIGVLCAELRKSKVESNKALAQQIGELTKGALAAAEKRGFDLARDKSAAYIENNAVCGATALSDHIRAMQYEPPTA